MSQGALLSEWIVKNDEAPPQLSDAETARIERLKEEKEDKISPFVVKVRRAYFHHRRWVASTGGRLAYGTRKKKKQRNIDLVRPGTNLFCFV